MKLILLVFSLYPSFLPFFPNAEFLRWKQAVHTRYLEASRDLNSNLSSATHQLAGLESIAGSPLPLLQNPNIAWRQIIKSDAVWKGPCFTGRFFTVWAPGKPLHWYHTWQIWGWPPPPSLPLYFPHWCLSVFASALRSMIHWQWYLHDIYNALYTQQLIHDRRLCPVCPFEPLSALLRNTTVKRGHFRVTVRVWYAVCVRLTLGEVWQMQVPGPHKEQI